MKWEENRREKENENKNVSKVVRFDVNDLMGKIQAEEIDSVSHSILLWLKYHEKSSMTQEYTMGQQIKCRLVDGTAFCLQQNFPVSYDIRLVVGEYHAWASLILWNDLHFLKNDALGVRGSTERIGLPASSQMGFFVVFVGPSLVTTMIDVLACCSKTSWFTWKNNSKRSMSVKFIDGKRVDGTIAPVWYAIVCNSKVRLGSMSLRPRYLWFSPMIFHRLINIFRHYFIWKTIGSIHRWSSQANNGIVGWKKSQRSRSYVEWRRASFTDPNDRDIFHEKYPKANKYLME